MKIKEKVNNWIESLSEFECMVVGLGICLGIVFLTMLITHLIIK